MASVEALAFAPPDWNERDNDTNAQVDALRAAPDADKQHFVKGITVSASGEIAATVVVQVIEDAADTAVILYEFQLPAATIAPIDVEFGVPLRVALGKSVQLRIPALGAGIVGRAAIRGITRLG